MKLACLSDFKVFILFTFLITYLYSCRIGYSIPMFAGFVIMFLSTISKLHWLLCTRNGIEPITFS